LLIYDKKIALAKNKKLLYTFRKTITLVKYINTMELKSYEKPWLPAFKGAFLIIFGILAMIQIIGSIKALAMLLVTLISALGILLIATTILNKNTRYKTWNIITGVINLVFGIYLIIKVESPAVEIAWTILIWIIFYILTEFIEAGILISQKNAFAALFIQDGLLSVLFGYFLYIAIGKFTPEAVFYIGIIALIIGITNVLSSYLLSTMKK
jgi:uncharacterized membrane protein HdeD (DUF308 family)